jgi:formylglycine-generating enzyme required for sulfatase activity
MDKLSNPQRELSQSIVETNEYWIGKYPVTNKQYKLFTDRTGYPTPVDWEGGNIPAKKENHPVVNVSWDDSVEFCKWASKVTGLNVYLPSEVEWEKASRGINGNIWPWGNSEPTSVVCNINGNDTCSIGEFSPNSDSPFNCVDMSGNISQWTSSVFSLDVGSIGNSVASSLNEEFRVLKGGNWFSGSPADFRCAFRKKWSVKTRRNYVGFRCCVKVN